MSAFRVAGDAAGVARELAELRASIARFRAGQEPEAVFLERRLRHGIYGQRQDGVHMLRSKLPCGIVSPPQLEAFADIAEIWGGGVAHLTTRQDIQVHFVALERTPDLLAAMDAADLSAREACGNVVRNVVCDPWAGVGPEPFDPTPYALGLAQALLRHPDGQQLGRKFKVSFSATDDPSRDASLIHDVGLVARVRDGRRGWRVVVGGGLGAVPQPARLFAEFVAVEALYPLVTAILRVFGRHGEKRNRARARLKFLVQDWGIDRFREAVLAEEGSPGLPHFPHHDVPAFPPGLEPGNQRQAGYEAVLARVPRGDLTPGQLRGLATLLRDEVGDTLRITPDQNLLVRFVATDRVARVRAGLDALGLGLRRTVENPVTCPGADTCKLGITSPRAAARAAEGELARVEAGDLRVHVSGCPNACAQHQVADVGFFGAARSVAGVVTPHYLVVLGGEAGGTAMGTAHGKVPAARLGETVRTLAELLAGHREAGETAGACFRRLGREAIRAALEPLQDVTPAMYREPGSEAEFRVVRGVGECAGEAVDGVDLELADAERWADAARDALADGGEAFAASAHAFDHAATCTRPVASTKAWAGTSSRQPPRTAPSATDCGAAWRRRACSSRRRTRSWRACGCRRRSRRWPPRWSRDPQHRARAARRLADGGLAGGRATGAGRGRGARRDGPGARAGGRGSRRPGRGDQGGRRAAGAGGSWRAHPPPAPLRAGRPGRRGGRVRGDRRPGALRLDRRDLPRATGAGERGRRSFALRLLLPRRAPGRAVAGGGGHGRGGAGHGGPAPGSRGGGAGGCRRRGGAGGRAAASAPPPGTRRAGAGGGAGAGAAAAGRRHGDHRRLRSGPSRPADRRRASRARRRRGGGR
jgi:sulfite reductase beta subunit-like hemoprotein